MRINNVKQNAALTLMKESSTKSTTSSEEMRKLKSKLNGEAKEDPAATYSKRLLESTFNYGDTLKQARLKNQSTTNQVKKVKYNFKSVASQVIRSKTSNSARQAALAARREVVRLKGKRTSSEYDEELENAITHAQTILLVAKKKVHNLENEEMAERTGVINDTELFDEEDMQIQTEIMENIEQMVEHIDNLDMSDIKDDIVSLSDDDDKGADPQDIKMLKMKHRAKEEKMIAKADSLYLKAEFQRINNLSAGSGAAPAAVSQSSSVVAGAFSGGIM